MDMSMKSLRLRLALINDSLWNIELRRHRGQAVDLHQQTRRHVPRNVYSERCERRGLVLEMSETVTYDNAAPTNQLEEERRSRNGKRYIRTRDIRLSVTKRIIIQLYAGIRNVSRLVAHHIVRVIGR